MTETEIHNIACRHAGCEAMLQLTSTTKAQHGLRGGHLRTALELAAAQLGWRRVLATSVIVCPLHREGLVCARCCHTECSCMGGPRFEVMPGEDE